MPSYANVPTVILVSLTEPSLPVNNYKEILQVQKLSLAELSSLSVYYSLIYPYLYYGCVLWENNYDAPLPKVIKLQNKAVRIINDVPPMESITPHHVDLHLLKLPDIVKLCTCLLFYDHLNSDKVPSFPLTLTFELLTYYTRSALSDHLVCYCVVLYCIQGNVCQV